MKVGVIGAGGMGYVHGSKYAQMPDVELHVFDISRTKTDSYAHRFKAAGHETLASLLGAVDVVDVCTPTDTHSAICLPALEAAKPTLVEKPMGGSLEDCDRMIEAADKSGAMLMPAQVVRFFPEHKRAHELIKAGAIGRPASVRLRRGGRAPVGSDGWFLDPGRSGGILLDLAVHEFDWLQWTLGRVTLVMSCSVTLGPRVADAEFVGDFALTTLTHEGGCISHVESTWMDPSGFRTTIEAAGSEGVIEFDSRQNPSLRTHVAEGASRTENLMDPHDDPYHQQLRAFLDAVRSGRPAPVSAADGRRAVELSLAAIESASRRLPVSLA